MKHRMTIEDILNKWNWMVSLADLNNLSTDYLSHPVKFGGFPDRHDLSYLYITCNLSLNFLIDYFGVSSTTIKKWLRCFGINKSVEQIQELTKRVNNHKWGVDFPAMRADIQAKNKKTNLERYGVENVMQVKAFQERAKQTCLEHYGVENPMYSEEIKETLRETNLNKYGVSCTTQAESVKEKLRAKVPETLKKMKNTCIERYGVEYYTQSTEHQNRLTDINRTMYRTKKKNGSLCTSQDEDEMYEILVKSVGTHVERQYRSDVYPFVCDFYIPDLDMYIEFQGSAFHWSAPFDSENSEHLKLVEKWKKKAKEINSMGKSKDMYEEFIKTWTVRDPLKRKIAKENNLNWYEFFTKESFIAFCEKLKHLINSN